MKLISTFFLFFLTLTTFSQSSSIKGITLEDGSGKPLIGVNIQIKSIRKFTTSDSDGKFSFSGVPIGKYEMEFSILSFETKIVSDVEVVANETFTMTVSLEEKKNQLEEVVIKKVKAKAESVNSLLSMQKNSVRVSDGISAETIRKTPDKTTSDVLKRISGASVQDNKFVVIRGLNDRYNTSYLNGAPLPSSEPDRKAFSFDIFPANMIDNLVIYKTASPDLPGEFAGGVIEINTKATPDKSFQSLSVGSGYNTVTTGKKQVYYKGGSTDWLGIDDGSRSIPSYVPSTSQFQTLQQTNNQSSITQIADIAKKYQSDWNLYEKTFSPNTSLQYTIGNKFNLKDDQSLGYLASVTYNKTNNYAHTLRKSYETPGALLTDQVDDAYSEQVLLGALANFSLKVDSNSSFTFKNMYSINSTNKVIERNGSLSQESDPLYSSTTARMFTSNEIYTGQLNGEHYLPSSKIKISWVGSYSNIKRSIPNERRNTYVYVKFDDGTQTDPFAFFSINTVGGESPGSMYVSKNLEDLYSTKVDVSRKVKFGENFSTEFKAGFFNQSRYRNFTARQLGYIPFYGTVNGINYGNSTFSQTIPYLDNASIFNSSNMGIISPNVSGLTLYDGTKGNDSYKASSKLNASYIMMDHSFFNIFRLIWGARIENYSQLLDSKADNGSPIKVDNSETDFLPSVNLICSVTKKQNIRLSFSKTLNRPEFRELAPFLFYDAETKRNREGTPDLKIAKVFNADLRYEIFPGKGQLFSISAFYKKFNDPIELQAQANNTDKYKNAKSGENKGVELEYRTLLSSVFGTENQKVLNDLTFFTNLAIIRSKVDISNLVASSTIQEIPLQGQSPYVFNAGLQYVNSEQGWSASANLNKIGDRIAFQGNQTAGASTPALWEKGRTFLDFQFSKSLAKKSIELKLNVQNILAQDLIFYQNNDLGKTNVTGINKFINSVFNGDSQNKNGYNPDEDDLVWITKFGPTFSLSVSYSF